MDEIEESVLSAIPADALRLNLTRSTIKMQHSASWSIDKTNSVEDLIICLDGRAIYLIEGEEIHLHPGDAMLIPRDTRFVGWNPSPDTYTGVAQHFSLEIFGQHDLMSQINLRRAASLGRWDTLEPLVRYYRQSAPPNSTTLAQHHMFMVLLIRFIEDAFISWRSQKGGPVQAADALDLSITLAATQISADPLLDGLADHVVENAPYNPDYFQREFRKKIGWTPRKFQQFKRMERAMHFLESGRNVKQTAAEIGYADVYYFSRMFKRYVGTSPTGYVEAVREARDGPFFRGDDDGIVQYPIAHNG
ncbi:helix-turn-helix domain-containing protein [Qingshengfaniella alkalisoli]|uniref:AraC family transcriptional regulator n=1 Tax=Qingshengfaniella alkalisoli TaxID=2599296 RepID=A0A5B8IXJ3_9RHOB|nr:AraC family transcriptional regulator [Qingshengfaniella alkalisoli]QDY70872.1 AraC family transcriptional regulator [Qingshengfaniella alkalisoli]